MASLSTIKDVDIDPSGVFKYILIEATDKATRESKMIVRGYGKCPYHADILDSVKEKETKDSKFKCVGGGRINHDNDNKKILVYGYSVGYGKADHQITVDILKKDYPEYKIEFSDEGY
ncbi:14 kDa phosphohistidine phosphatase [Strongyloides ratti]|uniref:Sex-regulated protein janus-B n=1 Tax=Strongyloides ratti TaxID=34506 RepID=A0A090LLD5_STRRB|nr:14 kDa phosphohistidine phosphatase [Strongyloides ratti]CEF70530.1 14 kDa phosphohistidine phosphatase [Strongyloides ratti]